jgi:hypothetical protein
MRGKSVPPPSCPPPRRPATAAHRQSPPARTSLTSTRDTLEPPPDFAIPLLCEGQLHGEQECRAVVHGDDVGGARRFGQTLRTEGRTEQRVTRGEQVRRRRNVVYGKSDPVAEQRARLAQTVREVGRDRKCTSKPVAALVCASVYWASDGATATAMAYFQPACSHRIPKLSGVPVTRIRQKRFLSGDRS